MVHKLLLTAVAAALVTFVSPSTASARGVAHAGFTHVGPGGVYHAGATAVGGYGGAYHVGGAYGVAGYHYGGAYGVGGYRYGGVYGRPYYYGAAGGYLYGAPYYYGWPYYTVGGYIP